MSKWAYDFSDAVADGLEARMGQAQSVGELRRLQAIYFRARYKESAEQISKRTGLASYFP